MPYVERVELSFPTSEERVVIPLDSILRPFMLLPLFPKLDTLCLKGLDQGFDECIELLHHHVSHSLHLRTLVLMDQYYPDLGTLQRLIAAFPGIDWLGLHDVEWISPDEDLSVNLPRGLTGLEVRCDNGQPQHRFLVWLLMSLQASHSLNTFILDINHEPGDIELVQFLIAEKGASLVHLELGRQARLWEATPRKQPCHLPPHDHHANSVDLAPYLAIYSLFPCHSLKDLAIGWINPDSPHDPSFPPWYIHLLQTVDSPLSSLTMRLHLKGPLRVNQLNGVHWDAIVALLHSPRLASLRRLHLEFSSDHELSVDMLDQILQSCIPSPGIPRSVKLVLSYL